MFRGGFMSNTAWILSGLAYSPAADHESEEFTSSNSKHTLLRMKFHTEHLEDIERLLQILAMLGGEHALHYHTTATTTPPPSVGLAFAGCREIQM